MNGKKLKSKMVEQGFTQRSLAKKTGIGLNHLNEILNNKVSPRLETIDKICSALDITEIEEKSNIFFK